MNRLARHGILAALATVLVGAPAGLIWAATASRAPLVVVAAGAADYVNAEGENAIATDAHYIVVAAIAGVLCGLVAALLAPRSGWPVVIGLAAGGLLAGLVVWRTGHLVDYGSFRHALRTFGTGRHFLGPIDLHAKAALVAWPLAAVLTYLIGYGLVAGADSSAPPATGYWDVPPRP